MPIDLDFIQQFIPGSSERTLLLLHGTGGTKTTLFGPLGRELDPVAALRSPRDKVLENGHPRFFGRLAEGAFDMDDLKRRTNELANFVVGATGGAITPPLGKWWRSVIPMGQTSPRASCCTGREPSSRITDRFIV